MGSKGILFLCISLAVILMIASDVAASRDLAEASTAVETSKEVESTVDGGYPGHGKGGYCHHGCCKYYNGKCKKCCSYAGEAAEP